MLKVVRGRREPSTGDNQITGCCNARMDVVKSENELHLRCHKCGEYIGNVVAREIALIDSHYEEFMKRALADKQLELIPLDEHLEELYPTYCTYVLKFAEQAARTTLRDFLLTQDT